MNSSARRFYSFSSGCGAQIIPERFDKEQAQNANNDGTHHFCAVFDDEARSDVVAGNAEHAGNKPKHPVDLAGSCKSCQCGKAAGKVGNFHLACGAAYVKVCKSSEGNQKESARARAVKAVIGAACQGASSEDEHAPRALHAAGGSVGFFAAQHDAGNNRQQNKQDDFEYFSWKRKRKQGAPGAA